MPSASGSHLKITSADLQPYMEWADQIMKQAKWKSAKHVTRSGSGALSVVAIPPAEQIVESLNLMDLALAISGSQTILTPEANMVVSTIRDGMCMGMYLAEQYRKRSGYDVLQQQNGLRALSGAQIPEFNAKASVASAIAVFGAAAYVTHELSGYKDNVVSSIKIDFPGVPEISFKSSQNGLMSVVYHFASYCSDGTSIVNNGLELVRLAQLYFEAIMQEIHLKEGSFSYKEPFTEVSYRFENSEFIVHGFKPLDHASITSVEFKKVKFDEIVGNRRGKHLAIRAAMMLCCYDPLRKRNPFLDVMGSFQNIRMGFGVAGTGKSLLIAAIATKMAELSDKIGLPFLFHPMPNAMVSTYQGGSDQNMDDWMKRLRDTDKIIYAPIDDAENHFMDRTRQGTSEGSRGMIGVFLRNTEGATAIDIGNHIIDLMTNLPEIVDPAVLSRVKTKFPIDGTRTVEDAYDQFYLWHRRFATLDKSFVDLSHTGGYVYLDAQRSLRSLVDLEETEGLYTVKDPKIAEAVESAMKKYPPTDDGFFAVLCHEVQAAYPMFSSRDIRNIQSAVDARVSDFDLPIEWFDDPKSFYSLEYDRKVELIREQVIKNMRGLKFSQMLHQEALRYLDTFAGIKNVEFERQVGDRVKQLEVAAEADARFRAQHATGRR